MRSGMMRCVALYLLLLAGIVALLTMVGEADAEMSFGREMTVRCVAAMVAAGCVAGVRKLIK